ncbi:MAG: laccase domain-containing protein [Nocardioidaceae bacterium]|nr:laccase domain-containing protein [Nocardioidaceae bacterium]
MDVAFTDRHGGVSAPPYDSLDLSRSRPGRDEELRANMSLLAREFGVDGFVVMRQVHGADVAVVDSLDVDLPVCDALVTDTPGVALCVGVGDCAPVVLADVDQGVVGVAHAGRPGVVAGVVPAVIDVMRSRGAQTIQAWIGPHVCGGCYEVPEPMRAGVAALVPAAYACTTWGTPSIDIGAAVTAQLQAAGCLVSDVSRACTRESDDFFSYRRDGDWSGRAAGIVVRRAAPHG